MPKLYHFTSEAPCEDFVLAKNYKIPGHVAQYLKSFQLDALRFLYKHFENNESCIFNDESQLGKTAVVAAFLDAVLPHDASRKCLIIVKNEECVINWKFHLDCLTKLTSKVAFNQHDVGSEIVYLTKWDCIQKSASLAQCTFDCIIIDNRCDLLSNKICSGYLLRNYENKVSLIVSSNDVVSNLQQFHVMLRLCGRLDTRFQDIRVFEETFSLPKAWPVGQDLLEAYFLKREKIINYCRDFRLRRYRHQYEEMLPLVDSVQYNKSLNMWRDNPGNKSSSSSFSIKILTSSSEKDAEELFKTYFESKEEVALNKEVSSLTGNMKKPETTGEMVVMSPLLFESDSDLEETEICERQELDSINEAPKRKLERHKNVQDKPVEKFKNLEKRTAVKSCSNSQKGEKKATGKYALPRITRSHLVTRSKSQKNKYLVHDIDYTKWVEPVRKHRKRRAVVKKPIVKSEVIKIEDSSQSTDVVEKEQNRRPRGRPRKIIRSRKVKAVNSMKSKIRNEEDTELSENEFSSMDKMEVLDSSPEATKSAKVKPTSNPKRRLRTRKSTEAQKTKEHKKIKKIKKTIEKKKFLPKNGKIKIVEEIEILETPPEINNKNASEAGNNNLSNHETIEMLTPATPVIILTSSTDDSTLKTIINTNAHNSSGHDSKIISPSPDLFSTIDDYDITCSQKTRRVEKEISPIASKYKVNLFRSKNTSCFDILEKDFQKERTPLTNGASEENILEITTHNAIHNSNIRINDGDTEITQIRNRTYSFQRNKITKYFLGSERLSQSPEIITTNEVFDTRRNSDIFLKTPKRQKISQKSGGKKSPKTNCSNVTPNSLTKWLIKSHLQDSDGSKNSKRRRLDLWFSD